MTATLQLCLHRKSESRILDYSSRKYIDSIKLHRSLKKVINAFQDTPDAAYIADMTTRIACRSVRVTQRNAKSIFGAVPLLRSLRDAICVALRTSEQISRGIPVYDPNTEFVSIHSAYMARYKASQRNYVRFMTKKRYMNMWST